MNFKFLRTLKLFLLVGVITLASCEKESDFAEASSETATTQATTPGAKAALDLDLFDGTFVLNNCDDLSDDATVTLFTSVGESGELRLLSVNDQQVFEIFTFNSEFEFLEIFTDDYQVTGQLNEDGEPVFSYFNEDGTQNFCNSSTALTLEELALLEGNFSFVSCNDVSADPVTFSTSLGESGILQLTNFNGETVLQDFVAGDGQVSTTIEGIQLIGTKIGDKKNWIVTQGDVELCNQQTLVDDLFRYAGSFVAGNDVGPNALPTKFISFTLGLEEPGALRLNFFNDELVLRNFTASANTDGPSVSLTLDDLTMSAFLDGDGAIWDIVYKGETYILNTSSSAIEANSGYVTLEGNDLVASEKNSDNAELFFEELQRDGKVALKSKSTGKYVSSENGKKGMTANRTKVGPWEVFTRELQADGSTAYKANNGSYVSSENGKKPLMANRPKVGPWEKFFLTGIN